jgi:hypothetical protein
LRKLRQREREQPKRGAAQEENPKHCQETCGITFGQQISQVIKKIQRPEKQEDQNSEATQAEDEQLRGGQAAESVLEPQEFCQMLSHGLK